jgi:predicted RNase H-like nuclease
MRNKADKRDKGEEILSVGIDGYRSGWVAVCLDENRFEVAFFKRIEEICWKYSHAPFMFVDMPIGLPENPNEIRPESKARQMIKGRSSCVFNVPCRQAVYADDYQEANRNNKAILGKGLSKQSFAISKSIREIDELLLAFPEYKEKLVESHPELCFAVLASTGKDDVLPIPKSKYTREGMHDRIEILKSFYDKTDAFIEYTFNQLGLSRMKEDCIDALCLAVMGMLGSKNGFVSIPENPGRDSRGLKMQMQYGIVQKI